MKPEKLLELYKEFYFREDEARVNLASRLQIPLAITLTFTSVYAYMIKGIELDFSSLDRIGFFILFLVSGGLYLTALVYFIRAFFGHTYSMLPSASATEAYRIELIETYAAYNDSDSLVEKHFQEYLYRYFNECSSTNTVINDKRSMFIHKSNTFSVLNSLPLAIAFIVFNLADIDKNGDKEYRVWLEKPVTVETKQLPIEITGKICPPKIEVDFSKETKEAIRARQTTPATPATPAEEVVKGGCTTTTIPTLAAVPSIEIVRKLEE